MNTIRVILAVDSSDELGDIRDSLKRQTDIEVVGEVEVTDRVGLLLRVAETGANVVIRTWPESRETPGICTLLMEYPELLIIGLVDKDSAVTCRQTITMKELSDARVESLLCEIRRALAGESVHTLSPSF